MSRGFWLSCFALSGAVAVLLAAYPSFDMQVAAWFFDPNTAKFPLASHQDWKLAQRVANWVPFLLLLPAGFALGRKLLYPTERILIAPSVVLFLLASLLLGPGLTSNLLLKENWGRPRPHTVQQFAGTAHFQPWWRPGGSCKRNCSFVSGEASLAFWTVAPASLAPAQLRPAALGAAVVFGAAVGSLRVAFGRHFVSDIVFAGLITIAVVFALYRGLLTPLRRNDARLERGLEGVSIAGHRWAGALLGAAGGALAEAGSTLRGAGQHLHKRVACL